MTSKNGFYCRFCGLNNHEVDVMIAGPDVFICGECVNLCADIVREEKNKFQRMASAYQLVMNEALDGGSRA